MLETLIILSWLSIAAAAVLFSEDVQSTITAIPITTTTETIVITSVPLSLQSGNAKAVIRARVTLTPGTGTTAVTVTIYRGTAISGGNVVGLQTAIAGTFTAGSPAMFEAEYTDVLQNVGGAQYCVSVKQTGASGNGSVTAALIDTKMLSG